MIFSDCKCVYEFSNVFRILNSDLSGIKDTEHIVDEMIGKEDDSTPTVFLNFHVECKIIGF